MALMILKPILLQYGITYILVNFVATQDFRGRFLFSEDSESIFANGVYKDFTSDWFLNVGQEVVGIMYINIFMPPIEWLMFWVLRILQRAWD